MSERDMRAGETRQRALFTGEWRTRGGRQARPIACWNCGAPDSRAPDHARGCPALPPVSKERLREIALECAAGWNATLERKAFAATAQ